MKKLPSETQLEFLASNVLLSEPVVLLCNCRRTATGVVLGVLTPALLAKSVFFGEKKNLYALSYKIS